MKTDICIVGGGVMGLATAYQISKTSDREVLILDQYGVGNEFCSSNDINRVFRYAYGNDELYTRIAVESLKLWREWEQDFHEQLLIQTGLLLLQGSDRNASAFNESSYQTLTRMELGAERLDNRDLMKRYPQFRADESFFDPHGGVLLASKTLLTIQRALRSKGARFLQAQAREIVFDDKPHLVIGADHILEFQKLVVTAGPWSKNLLRKELIKVRSTRQQLIYFRPRKGLDMFEEESCPVFFTDKHYGLPAAGIEAVKMSPKELAETADPDTSKRTVDEKQIVDCREVCRKFVPSLADGDIVKTKVCFYDMTENSDFVLDKDPQHPSIVYGYGFSGHGFKFAPSIGKILGDITLDRATGFDLERFSIQPSKRKRPSIMSHLGKGQ